MTPPGVYLWRGQTYVGQRAVAEAAGVAEGTVSSHLRAHGHLGRLGLGRGRHGNSCPPRTIPIRIAGRSWPSITAFAKAVGMSPRTAMKAARAGHVDRLLAALMASDAERRAAA